MIVRQSICLKQTDRTCWTIETHFQMKLNCRARRRTFHELNHSSQRRLIEIKVKNNGAVGYVGSSLTVHTPLFFVHKLLLNK